MGERSRRVDLPPRRVGQIRPLCEWAPAGSAELDLPAEAERLTWARRWISVPQVLDQGVGDGGSWLMTAAVLGRCAVNEAWLAEPESAAAAIGRGLRVLHDALPVDDCPFVLADSPPEDGLVVCHGDACAPNTLLHDDGSFASHVDLDQLGVADRWADLAIAAWSTEWNYGPGYDQIVYESYGIEPDPERIIFYRLLWDLG